MRFRDQLEAFLGRLIARIHVRVILARQTPVRLLDLLRLRVAPDAQHFVEIFFCHHSNCGLQIADCGLKNKMLFNPQSEFRNPQSAYLFSSTSTYSASMTLSSPPPVCAPPVEDAPAAEACSSLAPAVPCV